MPGLSARSFDAGDVVWIEFGPALGHEQDGRRPGLVLSPRSYNAQSSVIIVCPITRRDRPWPFKIAISPVGRIMGFAMIDQMKSIDPAERVFRHAGRISDQALQMARKKLAELLVP